MGPFALDGLQCPCRVGRTVIVHFANSETEWQFILRWGRGIALNFAIVFIFYRSHLRIDHDLYGGHQQLLNAGAVPAVAVFMVRPVFA